MSIKNRFSCMRHFLLTQYHAAVMYTDIYFNFLVVASAIHFNAVVYSVYEWRTTSSTQALEMENTRGRCRCHRHRHRHHHLCTYIFLTTYAHRTNNGTHVCRKVSLVNSNLFTFDCVHNLA